MSGDTPISISGNERSAYVSRPLEASYPLVFLDADGLPLPPPRLRYELAGTDQAEWFEKSGKCR